MPQQLYSVVRKIELGNRRDYILQDRKTVTRMPITIEVSWDRADDNWADDKSAEV